ncbi:hypothetical protein, partial [Caldithrix abyssi]
RFYALDATLFSKFNEKVKKANHGNPKIKKILVQNLFFHRPVIPNCRPEEDKPNPHNKSNLSFKVLIFRSGTN